VSDLGSIPSTDGLNKTPSVHSPSRSFPRSPSIANSSATTGGVVRSSDELPENDFHLPERSIAEMLTDIFFKRVYTFFPYVDEATFREQFSAAYNRYERSGKSINRERDHVPWLSLMNLVFAFACDYVDLPVDKIQSLAKIFASRANDLIISVCFEIGTLEVLQALLLLSIHLLSSMQLNKCWASVGSLVRTGQGLGLHLDPSNWKISELEKDMRKRLWWGLFCLDRYDSLHPLAYFQDSRARNRVGLQQLCLTRCPSPLQPIRVSRQGNPRPISGCSDARLS
jgi:Fungal specific transcription factor domain